MEIPVRRPGVVPAVQRLVALVGLFPRRHGLAHLPVNDHPFGNQSPEKLHIVSGLVVPGEVHIARPNILHGGSAHNGFLAAVNADNELRALRLPVVLFHQPDVFLAFAAFTLDREDLPPGPVPFRALPVNVLGEMAAAVDKRRHDAQRHAVLQLPLPFHQLVHFFPDAAGVGPARNDAPGDTPTLFVPIPRHNLIFQTVVLRVQAHGQHQCSRRYLRAVNLAPPVQLFRHAAPVADFPGFAQYRVDEYLQKLRVVLAPQEHPADIHPIAPRTHKGVELEAPYAGFNGLRVFRNPLGRLPLRVVFSGFSLAYRAFPPHVADVEILLAVLVLVFLFIKLDMVKFDIAEVVTVRALGMPFLLRSRHVCPLDLARPLDRRRAGQHDFPVALVGFCPSFRQLQRIALCPGAGRESVNLVHEHVTHGTTGKLCRAVGPGKGHAAAGERLHGNGVPAVAALGFVNLVLQHPAGPYHGRYAAFAEILREVVRRLDKQYRPRVNVNRPAHHVQFQLRLTNLGARLNGNLPDSRLRETVHDFPLVWRSVRPPAARLRA